MEEGVVHARRRLRKKGIDPDIQKRLDESCPFPHLFPRAARNDNDWTPRNGKRKGPYPRSPRDTRDWMYENS